MSTAALPALSEIETEPVDAPELVRDTVGVDRVFRLQVEYRKRLRGVRKLHPENQLNEPGSIAAAVTRAQRVRVETQRYKQRVRPIIVAAERLARYASGLIENARIPQIDKIELQLRNAELEAELIEARHLIG